LSLVVVRRGHRCPWVGHHRLGGRSFRIAFRSVIVCGCQVVVCVWCPSFLGVLWVVVVIGGFPRAVCRSWVPGSLCKWVLGLVVGVVVCRWGVGWKVALTWHARVPHQRFGGGAWVGHLRRSRSLFGCHVASDVAPGCCVKAVSGGGRRACSPRLLAVCSCSCCHALVMAL